MSARDQARLPLRTSVTSRSGPQTPRLFSGKLGPQLAWQISEANRALANGYFIRHARRGRRQADLIAERIDRLFGVVHAFAGIEYSAAKLHDITEALNREEFPFVNRTPRNRFEWHRGYYARFASRSDPATALDFETHAAIWWSRALLDRVARARQRALVDTLGKRDARVVNQAHQVFLQTWRPYSRWLANHSLHQAGLAGNFTALWLRGKPREVWIQIPDAPLAPLRDGDQTEFAGQFRAQDVVTSLHGDAAVYVERIVVRCVATLWQLAERDDKAGWPKPPTGRGNGRARIRA